MTAGTTTSAHCDNRSHSPSRQYEASTRTVSNPNHCHALTFLFYRINKCQTVTFELVAIERRVDDPQAPTGVVLNPPTLATGVAVHSSVVLAAGANRLDVARRALDSVAVERAGTLTDNALLYKRSFVGASTATMIPVSAREAALKQVDQDLVKEGLLDKVGGTVAPALQKVVGWTRTMAIPTPALLVKGCLDDCDVCEPTLKKQIDLDLARRELENQLLKKQIELLDQSQEYRCCPAGDSATPA